MKLRFDIYRRKFESYTLMFDLLRHSLREMGPTSFRKFIQKMRQPKEMNFAKAMSMFETDPEFVSLVPDLQKHHKKKLTKELPVTPNLKWMEYKGHAHLGLNASELILRVALFEAFMKQIHEHALLSKPELMATAKPNRPVVLKDLFQGGFDKFKIREISRQVREADRLCTKERAKFFQRRLYLTWGDDATVKRISELTEVRHELVHATPDHSVGDSEIQDARKLFYAVPNKCFSKAVELYSAYFEKRGS